MCLRTIQAVQSVASSARTDNYEEEDPDFGPGKFHRECGGDTGCGRWTRTTDIRLMRPALCHLSYTAKKLRGRRWISGIRGV